MFGLFIIFAAVKLGKMKSEAELKAVTQFVAEYATRLMGSGVHTSRVVRNTKRLGEALGVRVMVSALSLIHI